MADSTPQGDKPPDHAPRQPSSWTRVQLAYGIFLGLVGVGMVIVQGLSHIIWGEQVDFGIIPYSLIGVSVAVVLNISVAQLFERLGGGR